MGTGRGPQRQLVAVFGPTSSGKTRLSVELCLRIAEDTGVTPVVVSADSRQVYRYMDIGTSKTTREQMQGIRHEMLSVVEPIRKYELESYVTAARRHIGTCWERGATPMIVGGTAVYVQSLLDGWDVEGTASVRDAVRRDFPPGMADDAYATLRRLDRGVAARVHPNNYDGVINALVSVMARPSSDRSGRQLDRRGERGLRGERHGVRALALGLDRPPSELDQRVARTFDEQMERGLLTEVQSLAARYGLERESRRRRGSDNQVLRTHGYREFFEVARERSKPLRTLSAADVAEVRERVVAHIQAYTRRQRGAFRKLSGLRMIDSTENAYQAWRTALTRDT